MNKWMDNWAHSAFWMKCAHSGDIDRRVNGGKVGGRPLVNGWKLEKMMGEDGSKGSNGWKPNGSRRLVRSTVWHFDFSTLLSLHHRNGDWLKAREHLKPTLLGIGPLACTTHSFARTAYLFACSALLASIARSAVLMRLLKDHSLPGSWERGRFPRIVSVNFI